MFLFSSWIILAVIGGLTSNAFHFVSRFLLKDKDDPVVYAWFYETLKLLIFGIIALFDWKLIITQQSILLFLLLGLTETLGAYWLMKMHSHAHLSISTILYRTRLVWVAVLSFLLFGEALQPIEYVGILVLFGGLSVVVAPKQFFVDKGAIFANLASFTIALNLVILKMALPYGSASVLNAMMTIPIVFLFPIIFKNVKANSNIFKQKKLGLKTLAICINIISLYLMTWALAIGQASKVTAIYQSMMVFSVLAGIIFLHERKDIAKKIIGTVITLIGVLLLTVI